jgi:predicted ATPase
MASSRGGDTSSFPWLSSTQQKQPDNRRDKVATDELSNRAGLMFRLGYSEQDATTRLCQRIAWEFDPSCGAKRPASLSDDAVAKIVSETYARKPK